MSHDDATLAALDRYIDEHLDESLADLTRLTAVPSVSSKGAHMDEAARYVAELARRVLHGGNGRRVLAHAEIVVRAPDGDLAGVVGSVAEDRAGKTTGDALEICEHAIALLLAERVDRLLENSAVVHVVASLFADGRQCCQPAPWLNPLSQH